MATLSVASILAESAHRYPDKVAIVQGDTSLTYSAVWDQARRYAAVLKEQGVRPGDRVALLIPNIPHFAFAYFGGIAAGASVVPVHALLVAEEIQYVLEDCGAKVLVCAAPLLPNGAKGAELAGVPVLAVLDPGDAGQDIQRLDALAQQTEPLTAYERRDAEDEAVVLYTSGTTGKPKGATLTHANLVHNAMLSAFDVVDMSPDDVLLGALPLFHTFGQTVVMNAGFRRGATISLIARFDPATIMDTLISTGVTIFIGVPTMYVGLLEAARTDDRRPAFHRAVSGGSSLPLAVIERFKETFDADIYEGYGLSETSPVATFNQAFYGRKAGTVGHPIWGIEVCIAAAEVEGEIRQLGTGELGEICIRGHNIFSGYLNKPEATAEVMVDGWFRTGDLGTIDEEGFVAIVDRKKDLVIRGGFNVYPREVEEALSKHPDVVQVAVIGVPDETYGEEIKAVVVRAPGSTVDEDTLIAFAQEHVGRHKYPRSVQFVDAMPLGPSGKILKRELRSPSEQPT